MFCLVWHTGRSSQHDSIQIKNGANISEANIFFFFPNISTSFNEKTPNFKITIFGSRGSHTVIFLFNHLQKIYSVPCYGC